MAAGQFPPPPDAMHMMHPHDPFPGFPGSSGMGPLLPDMPGADKIAPLVPVPLPPGGGTFNFLPPISHMQDVDPLYPGLMAPLTPLGEQHMMGVLPPPGGIFKPYSLLEDEKPGLGDLYTSPEDVVSHHGP